MTPPETITYPGIRIKGFVSQAEAEYFAKWAYDHIEWRRSDPRQSGPANLGELYFDALNYIASRRAAA